MFVLTRLDEVGSGYRFTSSAFTRSDTQCVQFGEIGLSFYGKGSLFG